MANASCGEPSRGDRLTEFCLAARAGRGALLFCPHPKPTLRRVAAKPPLDVNEHLRYAFNEEHRPDDEARIPGRRFFNQPPGTGYRTTRTSHVHIAKFDSPQWRDPITFRDFFRNHVQAVRLYLNLKRSPVSRPYQNPSDYSALKAEFVASVLARATAC